MARKWIIRILGAAALIVFVYSIGSLFLIRQKYREAEKLYRQAAENYTQAAAPAPTPEETAGDPAPEEKSPPDRAPIAVDFDALLAVGPDVIGWIYCEGTVINYPVVHAPDNEYYLHLSYDGKLSETGTIFSDAGNRPGIQDSNIILYGHHMQDMSIFATLKYWYEQEYYDEHPYMWFLTPEQDYRMDLYSIHSTSATSDYYRVFYEPGDEFERYIRQAKEESGFVSDVEPDPQLHHLMLSTCAYSYYNERTVMHAQLVPVAGAEGERFPAENTLPEQ